MRREVTIPPTITTIASGVPDCAPASNSANLPMNPENGGSPPRLMAGMKYSTASTGAARISPFTRRMEVEPALRSMRPTDRNSVVCTMMWWTV